MITNKIIIQWYYVYGSISLKFALLARAHKFRTVIVFFFFFLVLNFLIRHGHMSELTLPKSTHLERQRIGRGNKRR